MTTYKNIEFENLEALQNAVNTELAEFDYPIAVVHKFYGAGQLIDIKAAAVEGSLFATVDFPTCTKVFALEVVLTYKLLTLPEFIADLIKEIQIAYKHAFNTYRINQNIHNRETKQKADAEKKRKLKEQRAEEKYQNTKTKTIQTFDELANTPRPISTADEFYYSLGYILKHIGTVTATLPDYLETAFKTYFGSDTPCRVVDSKKVGPAGYTSQWTWSFGISLKKPEVVPAFLQDKLNPSGKAITNTSFVWDLVENYGFQFGKKQDIDKIKSFIPSTYISAFEAGLA